MINRVLIRIKVLQCLYSYMMTQPQKTVKQAQKELQTALDKSFELYHSLLQLVVDLSRAEELRLDEAKLKFMPTEQDLEPDMRFVDNLVVKYLRENESFTSFINDHNITWNDDQLFLHLMLSKVHNSEPFKRYMEMVHTDLPSDCAVWRDLMRDVILPDEDFAEYLESLNVYWSEVELEIVGEFVMKTIRRVETGGEEFMMPQFRNDDDAQFGDKLLTETIKLMPEHNELIDSYVKKEKWDAERIAVIDRLIMNLALTEVKTFLSIPVAVSLNEYIEQAKMFSTPQSGQFVNGILHAVITDLKDKKIINKN